MKQRCCCFSTTIWLFCINFDYVPEKFNLHFASLVTKIGVDWHGINNSLSKTTEDGNSRQNSQPTIQAVQQNWNKADFLRNCKDENEEPADLGCLIVVSGTCQPSLHQQPEMREMLYKKCRWFDEDPQPANMSSSTSSHQRNRSRTSPKQLFQVAKLRKKVLRTTVSPFMEVESDFGPSQTPTASNNATQVIVQVSFPPNLVPREKRPGDEVAFHQDTSPLRAIVHINRKLELQPVAEVTATTFTTPVTISSSSQVAFQRLATLRFC